MGGAIDPYGHHHRHSLSDPRADDYSDSRDHRETPRCMAVCAPGFLCGNARGHLGPHFAAIRLPCRTYACAKTLGHHGDCDFEKLELIDIPNPFINHNPRQNPMKLEAPKNENSMFVKFVNIGDSVRGLFVSYGMNNSGSFGPKAELVLKTKEGPKSISCSTHLKQILDANAEKLPGKVVTVTLKELKNVGKGNPMKVFEVDVAPPGKAAPAPEPEPSDDEDIPF